MAPQGLHDAAMPMPPPEQSNPAPQRAPCPNGQQAWPEVPQAWHIPPMPFIAPVQAAPG